MFYTVLCREQYSELYYVLDWQYLLDSAPGNYLYLPLASVGDARSLKEAPPIHRDRCIISVQLRIAVELAHLHTAVRYGFLPLS